MTKVGFNDPPYYNADAISGALEPDDICNVYFDQTPSGLSIRRRPGLSLFANLGSSPGQGIFEWEAAGLVLAVSNGQIYTLSAAGVATNITTDALNTTAPVQFSDGAKLDGTPYLYMANGKLVYSDDGANTAYPTNVSTPSTADHVVFINLRFLANVPGTNRFLFTDTNPGSGILEPDYWGSSDNPLVAEAEGDDLLGLWMFLQEIYVWGSQSLEIFQDDGVTPFAPIPQAASNAGLAAKNSVVVANNTVMALCTIDGSKVVVRITGRTPESVSESISNILAGYNIVSDAIGQIISVGGVHIYLLQFPTAGVTWAFNMQSNTWAPWCTLDGSAQKRFIGQHTTFVKAWNKHLIMSKDDGKIYELDRSEYTDNDVPITSYKRTVWIDHDVGVRKRVRRLRVKLKRGHVATGSAYIRWANDGSDTWSGYKELTLDASKGKDFIFTLNRLGLYKTRKYEISIEDDADLSVEWIDEEVQALRS